jgi:hypothetical protein
VNAQPEAIRVCNTCSARRNGPLPAEMTTTAKNFPREALTCDAPDAVRTGTLAFSQYVWASLLDP